MLLARVSTRRAAEGPGERLPHPAGPVQLREGGTDEWEQQAQAVNDQLETQTLP